MRVSFFSSLLLVVLTLFCGTLMFAPDIVAQVASEPDDFWSPCDDSLMVGRSGGWAVFHRWCYKTGDATDVGTFARDDILRMEAQCPDTHFRRKGTIRRQGPDAIVYRTEPYSKFGPIFIAYYKSQCGIVKELCRASSEEMVHSIYSNFRRNVAGDYGNCIDRIEAL